MFVSVSEWSKFMKHIAHFSVCVYNKINILYYIEPMYTFHVYHSLRHSTPQNIA